MNSEISIDAMGKLIIKFKKNIFGEAVIVYFDYKYLPGYLQMVELKMIT